MRTFISIAVVSLLNLSVNGQTGSIEGTIADANTGNKISSASIQVVETGKIIAADFDGKYSLQLDASKTYSLRFSAVGYQTKRVDDIHTIANQSTYLNVLMNQSAKTEIAVEIRSSVKKESIAALFLYKKTHL